MIMLLATVAGADVPVGLRRWQTGRNSYRVQVGGPVRNYRKTDGTWAAIDNNWTVTDDSLFTITRAALKVRADRFGSVATVFTHRGTPYRISQRLAALVFFRMSDSLWIPIHDAPHWSMPTVDSNVVMWHDVFPDVDYRLIKCDGAIRLEITFQPAFLDSVVDLYNHREDCSNLYLANVASVSLENLDIIGGARNHTVLKRFNDCDLEQPCQMLHFAGSENLPEIKVQQVHQAIDDQMYLLELVKMSDLEHLHEQFPLAAVSHDATETLNDSHIKDTWLSRWSNDGDNNYGGTTSMDAFNTTPYLLDLDLSGIGGPVTVTAAVCSLRVAWMSTSTDFFLRRVVTGWTEGIEDGSPVTSGNPGATWNYAKDYYSGEGSDTAWADGNDWGSSDYTVADSAELDALVEAIISALASDNAVRLEVGGHTSSESATELNQRLAYERAQKLVTHLARRGVSAQRIVMRGYGTSMPLEAGGSDDAKNRRVTVRLVE